MKRLFSYVVRFDKGSAPNPFGGICTLNICKPVIRRSAKINDWIVGIASNEYFSVSKVIYAMEITEVKTMSEYDDYCKRELVIKIPKPNPINIIEFIGDSIYDYSNMNNNLPGLRNGVHDINNRNHDLSGVNCLLSENYYYFGNEAVELPSNLEKIVKRGQAHQSNANAKFFDDFLLWIKQFKTYHNSDKAYPNEWIRQNLISTEIKSKCESINKTCSVIDLEDSEEDLKSDEKY